MIVNFLTSFVTALWQSAKGVLGWPLRLLRSLFRLLWAIHLLVLDFLGSIFRPAMRFLAYVFLIVAAISLVADISPMLSGAGPFASVTLAEHWRGVAPSSLQQALKASQDMQWGIPGFVRMMLDTPTYLLFGGIGGLCAYAGRRRARINVFAN